MSYYEKYVLLCDQLTFDRLLAVWKLKGWVDAEGLRRPQRSWVASQNSEVVGHYLMYFSINHGESAYGIEEWIEEEHGVDSKHFSVWSRGESEDRWGHAGRLTGAMMPKSFTIAEYDINEENERKAPTGYKTYEYCGIAVDATVWEDYDIDYTRDEGYKQLSILEKSLLTTSYNLERIADILARMLDRMGSE